MSESANLLPHRPQPKQWSSVYSTGWLVHHRPCGPLDHQPGAEQHFLMDNFTLCAVASLICILILTRVIKKKRQLQSIQSKGTQTSNPVLNLDDSINRLSSELSTLQDRMENLEHHQLQGVTTLRMGSALPTQNENDSAQSVEPNQEKILWPGARPSYPSF